MGRILKMPQRKEPEPQQRFLLTQDIIHGYSTHEPAPWRENLLIAYFGFCFTIPAKEYKDKRAEYYADIIRLPVSIGDEWAMLQDGTVEVSEVTDIETGDVIVMVRVPFRHAKVDKFGDELPLTTRS